MWENTLITRLTNLMEYYKLNVSTFSKKLKVQRSTAAKWFNGESKPKVTDKTKDAKASATANNREREDSCRTYMKRTHN